MSSSVSSTFFPTLLPGSFQSHLSLRISLMEPQCSNTVPRITLLACLVCVHSKHVQLLLLLLMMMIEAPLCAGDLTPLITVFTEVPRGRYLQPILQMHLRQREVRSTAQGCIASKWSWDLNPGVSGVKAQAFFLPLHSCDLALAFIHDSSRPPSGK